MSTAHGGLGLRLAARAFGAGGGGGGGADERVAHLRGMRRPGVGMVERWASACRLFRVSFLRRREGHHRQGALWTKLPRGLPRVRGWRFGPGLSWPARISRRQVAVGLWRGGAFSDTACSSNAPFAGAAIRISGTLSGAGAHLAGSKKLATRRLAGDKRLYINSGASFGRPASAPAITLTVRAPRNRPRPTARQGLRKLTAGTAVVPWRDRITGGVTPASILGTDARTSRDGLVCRNGLPAFLADSWQGGKWRGQSRAPLAFL